MELRSLEGLATMAESPINIVAQTFDQQTGQYVAFDGSGNMYSLNVLTGAMTLLIRSMLPSGISRIQMQPNGTIVAYSSTGELYTFAPEALAGLGSIFKKIGQAIKNTADKIGDTAVGKVIRTVATPVLAPAMVVQSLVKGESLKEAVNDSISRVKEDGKATGDLFGKAIRFINRYLNPAAILLRNGWLIAMKINLFGVARTLRWAYAPSYEYVSQRTGMSQADWDKVKEQARKIETVYWQAGGMEENLRKAILTGKGNHDGAVPKGDTVISTANDAEEAQTYLTEFDDNGNPIAQLAKVNADGSVVQLVQSIAPQIASSPGVAQPASLVQNLLQTNTTFANSIKSSLSLKGLGEPASAAALATVSGAVAAVSAFLKPITDLINKGKETVNSVKDSVSNLLPGQTSSQTALAPQGAFVQPASSQPASSLPPYALTTQPGAVQTPASTATGSQNPNANPTEESLFKKPMFWVGSALAAGVLGTGIYFASQKRSGFSGSQVRSKNTLVSSELSGLPRTYKTERTVRKRATARKPAPKNKRQSFGIVQLT